MHGIINPGSAVNFSSPLNRGLESWWLHLPNRLGGGGNTFRDLMRRNHGTLTNGPTWGGARGAPGNYGSLVFDGSDDYIALPAAAPFNLPAFTIAALYRPTAVGSLQYLFAKDVSGQRSYSFGFGNTSGRLIFADHAGPNTIESGNTVVTAGDWQLSAVTRPRIGGTASIYHNGKLDWTGTSSGTFNQTNTPRIGGREFVGFTQPFGGNIASVWFYNRALSAAEVMALYQDSRAGYPTTLNWQRPRGYAAQVAAATSPFFYQRYIAGRAV